MIDGAGIATGRPWRRTYAAVVLGVFAPLYLLTRSAFLISDGPARVAVAVAGDPSN